MIRKRWHDRAQEMRGIAERLKDPEAKAKMLRVAADYEKVHEDDKVSVLGLSSLAPGQDLDVELMHRDGKRDSVKVKHTLNAEQVEWFKAGSALNLLKKRRG